MMVVISLSQILKQIPPYLYFFFIQPSLEQRCSQLVGISILVTNFTGKLPKFIRLKAYGFAIRQLGTDYIMVSY